MCVCVCLCRSERNCPASGYRRTTTTTRRASISVSRETRGELVNPDYDLGGIWEAAWKREADKVPRAAEEKEKPREREVRETRLKGDDFKWNTILLTREINYDVIFEICSPTVLAR